MSCWQALTKLLIVVLAILGWGVLYQMWNATFASYFQELFPTRTRVTGFAVSQNIGLAITAFLPTVFALIAPPGRATCRWSSARSPSG